jgi:hypothetical protein
LVHGGLFFGEGLKLQVFVDAVGRSVETAVGDHVSEGVARGGQRRHARLNILLIACGLRRTRLGTLLSFHVIQMLLQGIQQTARSFREVRNVTFIDTDVLGHFQKFGNLVHPDEELLVNVESLLALFLIHIEEFFCK